jgi:DNA primase
MINYEMMEDIMNYYHNNLKFNMNKELDSFFTKYGIEEITIHKFNLGLALDDDGLSEYLVSEGYSMEEILATSLVELEGTKLVDFAKNKVIIPILDESGRCVAFCDMNYIDIKDNELSIIYCVTNDVPIFNYNNIKDYVDVLDYSVEKIYLTDIVTVLELDGRNIDCACSLTGRTISPLEITMIKAVTNEVVILLSSNMYNNTENVYNILRLLEAGINVTIIPKRKFLNDSN